MKNTLQWHRDRVIADLNRGEVSDAAASRLTKLATMYRWRAIRAGDPWGGWRGRSVLLAVGFRAVLCWPWSIIKGALVSALLKKVETDAAAAQLKAFRAAAKNTNP